MFRFLGGFCSKIRYCVENVSKACRRERSLVYPLPIMRGGLKNKITGLGGNAPIYFALNVKCRFIALFLHPFYLGGNHLLTYAQ